MRNPKLATSPRDEGFHGAEMRRRIADCRERLRRERAARRISERASPPVEGLSDAGPETALAACGLDSRGEET